jgi:hypothetical protein
MAYLLNLVPCGVNRIIPSQEWIIYFTPQPHNIVKGGESAPDLGGEAGAPNREVTAEMIEEALRSADGKCHLGDFADGKTIVDGCFDLRAVAEKLNLLLKGRAG